MSDLLDELSIGHITYKFIWAIIFFIPFMISTTPILVLVANVSDNLIISLWL